jgi:hypothetical protein
VNNANRHGLDSLAAQLRRGVLAVQRLGIGSDASFTTVETRDDCRHRIRPAGQGAAEPRTLQ